jgi:hypothetical protein
MQTEDEASSMDPWSLFVYGMNAPMTREKYASLSLFHLTLQLYLQLY